MEPDPPDLALGSGIRRRDHPQIGRVPIGAAGIDSHRFEAAAKQGRELRVAPEAILDPRDRLGVGLPIRKQGVRHVVDQPRGIAQGRDLSEHDDVARENQLTAPLVLKGLPADVDGDAQEPGLDVSSCFGVSFFGSMNGISTTVAETVPSGRSTSSSVPSSDRSMGTIAYPMFFSRRGE